MLIEERANIFLSKNIWNSSSYAASHIPIIFTHGVMVYMIPRKPVV